MDIKGVVKAHDFTLIEVAEKMGITKGAISQVVNGSPNIKTLRAIANIVGCKVGDFFLDEMTEEPPKESSYKCPHCGKKINIVITDAEL